MKVQKNQKTNQLFLNLPKQLCRSMQIFKGTEIKLHVKGQNTIELLIEGANQNGEKEASKTREGNTDDEGATRQENEEIPKRDEKD